MNTLKLARYAHSIAPVNLSKRRQWFADTDATTSADTTTTTTEADKDPVNKPKTFTEADLERIVKERVSRGKLDVEAAKAALLADLAKETGIDEADASKLTAALKGKLTTAKQAEDAQKSDLQKAQDALAAAEKKAADAEAARVKAEQERRTDKLNTRVETLAAGLKAQVPADVVDYLQKHNATELASVMNDQGVIDDKAVTKLLETVKTARPHWFSATGGAGIGTLRDGHAIKPGAEADKAARDRQFRAIRRNT